MTIGWRPLFLAAAMCLEVHQARADVSQPIGTATVNWSEGLVSSWVVGVADRRAPSPVSARAAARRRGLEQGATRLFAAVSQLPWAGPKPAVDRAFVASALTVAKEELLPDGSWRLNVAVPVEALRQLRDGPRQVAAAGDAGERIAVFVDAAALRVAPRVGVSISWERHKISPPIVWMHAGAPKLTNVDRRIEVRALRLRQDTLEIDGEFDPAQVGGALFVVVLAKNTLPEKK